MLSPVSVRLSVCLSVCKIIQKLWTDLGEFFFVKWIPIPIWEVFLKTQADGHATLGNDWKVDLLHISSAGRPWQCFTFRESASHFISWPSVTVLHIPWKCFTFHQLTVRDSASHSVKVLHIAPEGCRWQCFTFHQLAVRDSASHSMTVLNIPWKCFTFPQLAVRDSASHFISWPSMTVLHIPWQCFTLHQKAVRDSVSHFTSWFSVNDSSRSGLWVPATASNSAMSLASNLTTTHVTSNTFTTVHRPSVDITCGRPPSYTLHWTTSQLKTGTPVTPALGNSRTDFGFSHLFAFKLGDIWMDG